jgi:hypothetical protein
VAKIAYCDSAELNYEAEAHAALAAAGVTDAPQLLHAAAPRRGRHAPFLVQAPRGVPLTSLLGDEDDESKRYESRAARVRLAEAVAADLLRLLRGAHWNARLIHGNIKPQNIVLVPRNTDGDGENEEDKWERRRPWLFNTADELAARVDARTHRALLIDWANPVAWGERALWRHQRGYCRDATDADVAESWRYFAAADEGHDLECVAYLYASIIEGAALRAEPPPPWMPAAAADGTWREDEAAAAARGVANEERARKGRRPLGPLAWRRQAWLCAHPSVLGKRGRRFLERVHAGGAPYSMDDESGGGGAV